MHDISVSFPCATGCFMGSFTAIRRDLCSFPEKFFFDLSLFTRGKMRETRPQMDTAMAYYAVEGHAQDKASYAIHL
jgi:hypothetical protein